MGMRSDPIARFDSRFSDPQAGPTPWQDAADSLERAELQRLADAYEAKYGSVWHFDVGDGVFGEGEDAAAVFRIEPAKVLAFAKEPHAHTSFRFS